MFALYSSMKRPRRAAGGTPVAWTIAVPLALCASPLEVALVGGDHFQFQFNLLSTNKIISYRKQQQIPNSLQAAPEYQEDIWNNGLYR